MNTMELEEQYVKCDCWHCGNHIEYPRYAIDEEVGPPMVVCPICLKDTQLYSPADPLTIEALQFLATLSDHTNIPLFISNKLRRMALANGVAVEGDSTASDVIGGLRGKLLGI